MLAREEVAAAFQPGDHGSTFGGNPVVCAAANATLCVIQEENLPARADRLGRRALGRLREAAQERPAIRDVRGQGLLLGVELDRPGQPVVQEMLRQGVIANCTAGSVIRFLPALNIPEEDLDQVLQVFLHSLDKIVAGTA